MQSSDKYVYTVWYVPFLIAITIWVYNNQKNKESNTSRTILTFNASTSFTDSLVITRWDKPV
jgi:cbb3-type cytochrome oxidase subunit 3